MAMERDRMLHALRSSASIVGGYAQLLIRQLQREHFNARRVARHAMLLHAESAQLAQLADEVERLDQQDPPTRQPTP